MIRVSHRVEFERKAEGADNQIAREAMLEERNNNLKTPKGGYDVV
jgi:hypothetical protein